MEIIQLFLRSYTFCFCTSSTSFFDFLQNPFCVSRNLGMFSVLFSFPRSFITQFHIPYSRFQPLLLRICSSFRFYNCIRRHRLSLIVVVLALYLYPNQPMITHRSVPLAGSMRGPPPSPEQGSCHSPLPFSDGSSRTVPSIFVCSNFALETIRSTRLSNGLCSLVQGLWSSFVVNLKIRFAWPSFSLSQNEGIEA